MRTEHTNFRVVCAGDTAEIYLYDVIGADYFGGINAKQFSDELNKAKNAKNIDLRINSPGGDVFDGFTMYSLLKSHKAKINVYVDGLAASIASVIAMAGDSIEMSANAMMMIHDPWSLSMGTAEDFRKQADLLDKIRDSIVETYAARTKGDAGEIQAMMAEETWLTSQEAITKGFADRAGQESAIAACIRPELFRFKNMPQTLVNSEPESPKPTLEAVEQRIATLKSKWRSENAA